MKTPTTDSDIYVEHTDPRARQQAHKGQMPGWGADADPQNRPAVPKERTPPRLDNVHWTRPSPQDVSVKVFHSTERPGLTPVFGTTVPPSGLSGKMRELAFRFSENDLRHWLILLMADRVNVGEGLVSDLAHGHIPNLFAEMGLRSEWRYNRAAFVKKTIAVSALVGLAIYLSRRRRR